VAYRSDVNARDKSGAIAAVIAIHAALLFAFLNLSGKLNLPGPQDALRIVDFSIPPPPPPPPQRQQPQQAKPKQKEGGSAPKNIRSQATPVITRPSEAMQWLNAHHEQSPVTRHALMVLESIDAIDLAFDTFVCAMLDGEVDTSGYPEYNAIVGGVASHWDETTGDMIVRAVVGWGGKGVRGDTDRTGAKLLGGLLSNVLASQYALGLTPIERPVPAAGRGGLVCAHCGFASAHERAFYCPKCGMRLLRG